MVWECRHKWSNVSVLRCWLVDTERLRSAHGNSNVPLVPSKGISWFDHRNTVHQLGCPKSILFFWFSATQLAHVCLASYQGHLSWSVFHERAYCMEVARGNCNVHSRTSHTMMMMMMMCCTSHVRMHDNWLTEMHLDSWYCVHAYCGEDGDKIWTVDGEQVISFFTGSGTVICGLLWP